MRKLDSKRAHAGIEGQALVETCLAATFIASALLWGLAYWAVPWEARFRSVWNEWQSERDHFRAAHRELRINTTLNEHGALQLPVILLIFLMLLAGSQTWILLRRERLATEIQLSLDRCVSQAAVQLQNDQNQMESSNQKIPFIRPLTPLKEKTHEADPALCKTGRQFQPSFRLLQEKADTLLLAARWKNLSAWAHVRKTSPHGVWKAYWGPGAP